MEKQGGKSHFPHASTRLLCSSSMRKRHTIAFPPSRTCSLTQPPSPNATIPYLPRRHWATPTTTPRLPPRPQRRAISAAPPATVRWLAASPAAICRLATSPAPSGRIHAAPRASAPPTTRHATPATHWHRLPIRNPDCESRTRVCASGLSCVWTARHDEHELRDGKYYAVSLLHYGILSFFFFFFFFF
jgi:hypothetical protein